VTDPAKIIHSVLGHLMLGLVLLHFAGLAAHSIRHKEPIVLAMVTGERRHDE